MLMHIGQGLPNPGLPNPITSSRTIGMACYMLMRAGRSDSMTVALLEARGMHKPEMSGK